MKFFTIRKYDGDDEYSYAVFMKQDVKGMGNQIFYGQADPIESGLSKFEAQLAKKRLDRGALVMQGELENQDRIPLSKKRMHRFRGKKQGSKVLFNN